MRPEDDALLRAIPALKESLRVNVELSRRPMTKYGYGGDDQRQEQHRNHDPPRLPSADDVLGADAAPIEVFAHVQAAWPCWRPTVECKTASSRHSSETSGRGQ